MIRGSDRSAGRWRQMTADDLAAVGALAGRAHPRYPERPAVFADKLRLFPPGCLVAQATDGLAGYCFSHPWTRGRPPALDRRLGGLPASPTTYFIHDLAIDEPRRGGGLAAGALPVLIGVARAAGLSHMSLVAVGGSGAFWRRAGFSDMPHPDAQAAARSGYGDDSVLMEMQIG